MNKTDALGLWPDSNYDALVVDGVLPLPPKDQLALRNSTGYIVAASWLAGVGIPTAALTVALGMSDRDRIIAGPTTFIVRLIA